MPFYTPESGSVLTGRPLSATIRSRSGMSESAMTTPKFPLGKADSTLLERIQNNSQLPSLGLSVARIVSMLDDDDDSMQELGNLILSDVYLTQRILTLANSVMYRLHGTSTITTISKSIVVIGFEQVKLLALALILVDRLENKAQAQAMKTEFARALRASTLAQEFAGALLPRYREQAGIAGLLSSAARLLIIYLEFPAHQAIEEKILAGESERAAFKEVFGTGLNVFTQILIGQWHLPHLLKSAISEYVSAKQANTMEGQFARLVQASNAVADCYRLPPGNARDHGLAKVYLELRKTLEISREDFDARIAAGMKKMDAIHGIAGIAAFLPAAEWPASGSGGDAAAEATAAAQPADPLATAMVLQQGAVVRKDLRATGQPTNTRELVLSGLQDVSETIAVGQSLVTALRSAVECIHRGFGFARSVLLLKDPATQLFRARIWCGDVDKAQLHLLQFNAASSTDLFALACTRGVDVQITDMEAVAFSARLPAWMKRACPSARSFIILPVINAGQPIGCLYLERNCVDTTISAEELTLLQTVKNHIVLALRTIRA